MIKISNKIGFFGKISLEGKMHSFLHFAKTPYIEAKNLLPLMGDYVNPRDCLARLVKKKNLIRLKNGFFLISDKIEQAPVPYEQIANLLHGPSYVSFEWALAYYGLIPEGVYVVTSVTTSKSRSYVTPVATFDYIYLSLSRYAVGMTQKENEHGHFLIATPEKALADLVYHKVKITDRSDLLIDLIEGRRMNEEDLRKMDKQHLLEIATQYRSRAVTNLINALGML